MINIFRHLRPHWVNKSRLTVEPFVTGGISFLLRSEDRLNYNVWVYITPDDAMFSEKHAKVQLLRVADKDIVPFTKFELKTTKNLSWYLYHHCLISLSKGSDLPSGVYATVSKYLQMNKDSEDLLKALKNQIQQNGLKYE